MIKTAIITDSNSGITFAEAEKLGVRVIPMPILIDGEEYFDEINMTKDMFYEKLTSNCSVSTSQPSPETVMDYWNEALKTCENVVYIPMSSGLSGSYQTANMLSEDFDGKVFVANNQRISVTMRQSVIDAVKLAGEGLSGREIVDILEKEKFNSSIYIMLDTLSYLKNGGRLTSAVANLSAMLKIKPVLQIQGEKLDAFSVVRTVSQGKNTMLNAIAKDFNKRFDIPESGKGMHVMIAHTHNLENAMQFLEQAKAKFPEADFYVDDLSLSVSCHIGPGSLAIACSKAI